jgi:23S rRNA pseudouridine1911/1915/1917 synthase
MEFEEQEHARAGSVGDDPENPVLLARQALHAHTLRFLHPITHVAMSFEAPLADDIAAIVETVRSRRDAAGHSDPTK